MPEGAQRLEANVCLTGLEKYKNPDTWRSLVAYRLVRARHQAKVMLSRPSK